MPPFDSWSPLPVPLTTVAPVPIPRDCTADFNDAYHGRPELLLDPAARRACLASSFVEADAVTPSHSNLGERNGAQAPDVISSVGPPTALALDSADRRLVQALSRDGRRSAAALAKELGLSRQAVAQRLKALERRGVIRGYRAEIDPTALGLTVRAQIRLALDGWERFGGLLRLEGHVASAERFYAQPAVLDGASELLVRALGEDLGAHARTAYHAGRLPLDAPVELAVSFALR